MEKFATLLWGIVSERFIKFIPSEESMFLVTHKNPAYQNAFRLLTIIAERARRYNGHPDGLKIGQCHLGKWSEYGMSEQNYKSAKKILERRQLIKIIETNRTRKKATTGITTEGTLVELISSTVYDININEGNDRSNDRVTTGQRLANDKQEGIRSISNDIPKKEEAQTAKRLRSKDLLVFNFESWGFEGIEEKDLADWKLMYPHIDLTVETLKAAQWLKNNQSKSNKKSWRKYLTGWFGRSNDAIENKKAYKAAIGSQESDRRTKDAHGIPVENQYKDRF